MRPEHSKTNSTQEVLRYWQHLRRNDCFTDLTVYCGMNFGCVSLHGAVLGACSPFIASLLTENSRITPRDENVLFLPDCEKEDFVALVKVKKHMGVHYLILRTFFLIQYDCYESYHPFVQIDTIWGRSLSENSNILGM